jgi:pilus assembly protein Flp/PilA
MQDCFLKLYVKMQGLKGALMNDQRGQDLIEYALVVSLIALAATAGMSDRSPPALAPLSAKSAAS